MILLQQNEYRLVSDLRAYLDGYAAREAATHAALRPEGCQELKDALSRLRFGLLSRDYPPFGKLTSPCIAPSSTWPEYRCSTTRGCLSGTD